MLLRLRAISAPMDAGSKVELKFSVELGERFGELYLRVRVADAAGYEVGDIYAAQLVKVA